MDNYNSMKSKLDQKTIENLVDNALQAREKAYVPYSNFRVGAALLADNGQVFTGCNVENASYGLAICAERNAVFQAVASGQRSFRAIAIASDASEFCVPCGACRQVLIEFAKELPVFQANDKGEYQATDITDLLPGAFTGDTVIGGKGE